MTDKTLARLALEAVGNNKSELARRLGSNPATITFWIKGIFRPNEESQKKLREVISNAKAADHS